MNLILYKTLSSRERVNKTLTKVAELTGNIKAECSVINPIIIVESTSFPNANYLYCPEFARFYYINNIVCNTTGLYEISAHVDVLMSNASAIRKQKAVVAKQQNRYNLYLNDPDYRTYADPWVITREFPSGFSDPCYLLTLRGGHT